MFFRLWVLAPLTEIVFISIILVLAIHQAFSLGYPLDFLAGKFAK
jgi:hypothetical protein